MRLRFILCPKIPDDISQQNFFNNVPTNSKHDWRSLASEQFALEYLGIRQVILDEDDLINRYSSMGLKVPEVVAIDPFHKDRIISVEVKRICGNQLPLDFTGQTRRKLKRGKHYIWPWQTTIYNSLRKAHPILVKELKIHVHHIVFVIPSSLTRRSLQRMCDQICLNCQKQIQDFEMILNHVTVHVIQGDDELFDRF